MKQFACGSVVPGCVARSEGHTDEDILGQVAVNARDDHGMTEVPDEVVAQVRERIVEVA